MEEQQKSRPGSSRIDKYGGTTEEQARILQDR
jgi:hypothetical protein